MNSNAMLPLLAVLVVAFAAFFIDAAAPATRDCVGLKGVNPRCRSKEAAYQREYFYIGGRYVPYPVFGGNLVYDQLYVEKLIPSQGVKQPYPLVFFHGGGSAGSIWLQTPDNRKGFASYFIDLGYAVYLVDQTSVGRATQNDLPGYPLRVGLTDEIAEQGFSAPEITNAYPQSQLHTQWPGVSRLRCTARALQNIPNTAAHITQPFIETLTKSRPAGSAMPSSTPSSPNLSP